MTKTSRLVRLLITLIALTFLLSCARTLNQQEETIVSKPGPDTLPPATPQGFRADNGDDSLLFYWEKGVESDLSGYMLYVGSDTGVFDRYLDVGNTTSYELTDLVNNQQYFFMLRAYDKSSNLSDFSTELVETPVDTKAPEAPTVFQLREITSNVSSSNYVELTWKNPPNTDFQGVWLVRKKLKPPSSQNDGEIVASGNIETYKDDDVVSGTKYYYRIYAYDEIPNFSAQAPIRSAILVQPSSIEN